jgi:hypothetical protein
VSQMYLGAADLRLLRNLADLPKSTGTFPQFRNWGRGDSTKVLRFIHLGLIERVKGKDDQFRLTPAGADAVRLGTIDILAWTAALKAVPPVPSQSLMPGYKPGPSPKPKGGRTKAAKPKPTPRS